MRSPSALARADAVRDSRSGDGARDLAVWDGWADDLRGVSIASGHHLAEEAPEQLAETLRGFFS